MAETVGILDGASVASVDVSVVVPVYNSEHTIELLCDRIAAVLEAQGTSFEIVMVDDGSRDGSWSRMREIYRRRPEQVTIVQLMRNFGQHNALMCGFRQTRGRAIVTIDDDLQNPPEEIPKLLAALERQDLDLVYGCYQSKKHGTFRNFGSFLTRVFYRLVFKSEVDVTSFRAIRRPLLASIFSYALNFTYIDGLLAWNTQRVGSVVVEHHLRDSGRSGYSARRLLVLAFNLFTNFSLLPLQFVSGVGCLVAGSGFAVGLTYLYLYFVQEIEVAGYASIIVAVLVLGGTQLVALGVMGEYLGRLHINVNRKPQYTMRSALGEGLPPTDSSRIETGFDEHSG